MRTEYLRQYPEISPGPGHDKQPNDILTIPCRSQQYCFVFKMKDNRQ